MVVAVLQSLGWRLSRDTRPDLCNRGRHCLKMFLANPFCWLPSPQGSSSSSSSTCRCCCLLFLFCDPVFLLDLRAYNHGLTGPQKNKTCCDNKLLRSYLSPSVVAVRSGTAWRQDLAILSPEGFRDSTFQLRAITATFRSPTPTSEN